MNNLKRDLQTGLIKLENLKTAIDSEWHFSSPEPLETKFLPKFQKLKEMLAELESEEKELRSSLKEEIKNKSGPTSELYTLIDYETTLLLKSEMLDLELEKEKIWAEELDKPNHVHVMDLSLKQKNRMKEFVVNRDILLQKINERKNFYKEIAKNKKFKIARVFEENSEDSKLSKSKALRGFSKKIEEQILALKNDISNEKEEAEFCNFWLEKTTKNLSGYKQELEFLLAKFQQIKDQAMADNYLITGSASERLIFLYKILSKIVTKEKLNENLPFESKLKFWAENIKKQVFLFK